MNDTNQCFLPLDEAAISMAMYELGVGRPAVQVLDSVDSTNNWLLERLKPGSSGQACTVCAAEHQTAGRGRRGKAWHTPELGVTFSLSINIPLPLSEISGVSLLAGAAVCDCLRNVGAGLAMVKWPNDILVRESKLCGILVEVASYSEHSTTVIIGIGVNYRRGPEVVSIDQSSMDLFDLCDGHPPDRSALIGSLAGNVYQCVSAMRADSLERLKNGWSHYDALNDRIVEVHSAGERVIGTAAGIDDMGLFRLRTADRIRSFSSADVSVRPKGVHKPD